MGAISTASQEQEIPSQNHPLPEIISLVRPLIDIALPTLVDETSDPG